MLEFDNIIKVERGAHNRCHGCGEAITLQNKGVLLCFCKRPKPVLTHKEFGEWQGYCKNQKCGRPLW